MIAKRLCLLLAVLITAPACFQPYVPPAVGPDGAPVRPVTVAEMPSVTIAGLATDGEAVFASVRSDRHAGVPTSQIVRIDAQGVVPILTGLNDPAAIAADATHVYWIDTAILRKAPRSGGAFTELARLRAAPGRLVSMGDRLAWIGEGKRSIEAVAKSGGPVTTVVREDRAIAAIAASDAGLVWATDREVRTLRDGAPTTLFAATGVRALTTHGSDVYWEARGEIWRGGAPVPVAKIVLLWVGDLAADDAHVYWTDRDEHLCAGTLVAPREGGEPRRLGASCSAAIVSTSRGVFWSTRGAIVAIDGRGR